MVSWSNPALFAQQLVVRRTGGRFTLRPKLQTHTPALGEPCSRSAPISCSFLPAALDPGAAVCLQPFCVFRCEQTFQKKCRPLCLGTGFLFLFSFHGPSEMVRRVPRSQKPQAKSHRQKPCPRTRTAVIPPVLRASHFLITFSLHPANFRQQSLRQTFTLSPLEFFFCGPFLTPFLLFQA